MRLTKRIRWRVGFARVVCLQLRSDRPPEVASTYRRLRASGVTRWRAYRLLISVYEAEVASMLREGRVYDHERYLHRLLALPTPPSETLAQGPPRAAA